MAGAISMEKAKELLDGFKTQAEELLQNRPKLEELLQQAEAKVKNVPGVGEALSRFPLMVSMIRAYITKEYTVVSTKVIITMICALIYLISGNDLIPDSKPVVGMVDDLAVVVAAFALVDPELKAYEQWRAEKEPAEEAPAE